MRAIWGDIPPQSPEKFYEALLNANWAYSGAAGAVFACNSEKERTSFGNVYCECTFTVTGIGTGSPQLAATQIKQTFNMDAE